MASTLSPAQLDEVVAGLDHVLELLDAVRPDLVTEPSARTRLDACQRRAGFLLRSVIADLERQAAPYT